MGRYILRRLLISIPVLFGITLVTYLIVSLAPGDPVSALVNPEQISELGPGLARTAAGRARSGQADPGPLRAVDEGRPGQLGSSYTDRQPVSDKISERIWPTVKLMLTVQILALIVAVPIGIISAIRQYSVIDYLVTIFGFAAISIPAFFLALAAIYVFAIKLQWLPAAGMSTPWRASVPPRLHQASDLACHRARARPGRAADPLYPLQHAGNDPPGLRARGARQGALRASGDLPSRPAQCPDPARHRGRADPAAAAGRHRDHRANFSWPGMGTLAIKSVRGRGLSHHHGHQHDRRRGIVISSLIADIIYAWIDPRISYS